MTDKETKKSDKQTVELKDEQLDDVQGGCYNKVTFDGVVAEGDEPASQGPDPKQDEKGWIIIESVKDDSVKNDSK